MALFKYLRSVLIAALLFGQAALIAIHHAGVALTPPMIVWTLVTAGVGLTVLRSWWAARCAAAAAAE